MTFPSAPEQLHPLRRLRHTRWVTLRQLHGLTGVHYSALSLIERYLLIPSRSQRVRIARALGVEPTDLFGPEAK